MILHICRTGAECMNIDMSVGIVFVCSNVPGETTQVYVLNCCMLGDHHCPVNCFAIVDAFVQTCFAAIRLVSCLLPANTLDSGRNVKTLKTINKYLNTIIVPKCSRIVAGQTGEPWVSLLVSGQPVCK